MKVKFYNNCNSVVVTKEIFRKVEATLTRSTIMTNDAFQIEKIVWIFEDGSYDNDMTFILETRRESYAAWERSDRIKANWKPKAKIPTAIMIERK